MGNRQGHGKRWLRAAAVSLVLLIGIIAGATAVAADDTPQFGIRPANPDPAAGGYFVLKAQLGQSIDDAIVVANPGTVPIKVDLYSVDAVSGQNGGAVYMGNNDPRKDVGAWVTLEQNQVDVPPQQQATITFTVKVPNDTRAGQHLGGIAAQLDRGTAAGTAQAGGASFGITTVTRALTAVLVNVGGDPGPPSLHITGAQMAVVDGLPTLTLGLANDGTSLLKAQGEVTMLDTTGKPVLDTKLALDTLVPQTNITYPVQADPPSTPGTYKVHVSLDFGGAAPAVYDGNVTVIVQPTATAITTGRTRATAVAGNPAPAAAPATATTPTKSGGNSPMIAILGAVVGGLAILVIGMGIFVMRSRRAKPAAAQAQYPPQIQQPPYSQQPQQPQQPYYPQQPPPGQPYDPRRTPPPGTPR
jgi:hypothetical protein